MSTAELTPTCQDAFSSAGLLAALEQGWAAIRVQHPEVPPAVIVVGSGTPARASSGMKWGHFASSQWQHGDHRVAEVLVSGEGLARTAPEVFTTLLHEATHGLAMVRGVADTSRQGRWHNKRFAELAAVLGLTAVKHEKLGWSVCTMNPSTQDRYADVLTVLGAEMSAYRHPDDRTSTGRANSNNGAVLECACPRKVRASVAVVAEGPILCGVCETAFLTVEDR